MNKGHLYMILGLLLFVFLHLTQGKNEMYFLFVGRSVLSVLIERKIQLYLLPSKNLK